VVITLGEPCRLSPFSMNLTATALSLVLVT
jgi:hypothetical protein